jgi:hypothetical protein
LPEPVQTNSNEPEYTREQVEKYGIIRSLKEQKPAGEKIRQVRRPGQKESGQAGVLLY